MAILTHQFEIWFLVGVWPALAIFAKRWHDRDRSGWWNLITPALLPPVAGFFIQSIEAAAGQRLPDNGSLLLLIFFGSVMWTMVELGFVPGTDGANRYGPPVGGSPADLSARATDRGE